jgi:hypothetical protein
LGGCWVPSVNVCCACMWLAGFVLSLLRAGREEVEAMRLDRWVDRRMNVPCQDMMDVVCMRVLCDRTRSGCVFRVFVDESVQEVEEGRCYVYGYKLLLAALLITLSDVPFRVACGGRRSSSPPRWCRTPTIPTQPSCLTSQTCVCTSEDSRTCEEECLACSLHMDSSDFNV